MTGQIVIKSSTTTTKKPPPPSKPPSTTIDRRQRLITKTLTPSTSSTKVGELAGVTTANCVIFSCCCPCLVLELLILSLYKLPRSLGRRIWRNRRRRKLMKSKKVIENSGYYNNGGDSYHDYGYDYDCDGGGLLRGVDLSVIKVSVDGSTVDLDTKMWEQFCEAGFWRSSSQRGS